MLLLLLTLFQQCQHLLGGQVGQEAQGQHLLLWYSTADVIL
jgi:hypothetical protein